MRLLLVATALLAPAVLLTTVTLRVHHQALTLPVRLMARKKAAATNGCMVQVVQQLVLSVAPCS